MLLQTMLLMLALASQAKAAQQPEQIARAWRISGKVVDAHSGAPLARCSVQIEPVADGGAPQVLVTGEDGQFHFDGLAQGKYQLTASKRGYLTQAYEEHDGFSTAIAVGPELKSEGLIFNVIPQAVISGVVADERGEPVRGAEVRLFKDQDQWGFRSTDERQRVTTDDRGIYELSRIDPGNYYVSVSAQPWYAQRAQPMQPNNQQQDDSNAALDVVYPTTFYPQVTDSDAATPIPVKGGERIQADITLTAQQAMRVRIRLMVQDPEHAGAYSVVMSQLLFGRMETVGAPTQTVRDGVMEITGVLPGHYEFTLTHNEPDGSATDSTRFSGDVTSGTTEVTPVDAESEVSVVGKVTSLDGKISSGIITLQPTQQRHLYVAPLNHAGEFNVKVPPGEYEIVGQIPQMYLARLRSQDGELKGHVLAVRAGSAPRLAIIASRGFGQINGVAKRGDQPAGGVMVLLVQDENLILFRRDQSDSDGTFTLGDIVPGRYHLLAVERGWELEWANRNVLDAFLKKSIPIEVHANNKLTGTVEVQSR
jgi:uncharacterized surface anchored protein